MPAPVPVPLRRRRRTDQKHWYTSALAKALAGVITLAGTAGAAWFANDPAVQNRETVRQRETDERLRALDAKLDKLLSKKP